MLREDAFDGAKAIAFGVCLVSGLRYVERLKVDAVGAVDEALVGRSILEASEVQGRSWKTGPVSEHEDKHATGLAIMPLMGLKFLTTTTATRYTLEV